MDPLEIDVLVGQYLKERGYDVALLGLIDAAEVTSDAVSLVHSTTPSFICCLSLDVTSSCLVGAGAGDCLAGFCDATPSSLVTRALCWGPTLCCCRSIRVLWSTHESGDADRQYAYYTVVQRPLCTVVLGRTRGARCRST